MTLSSKKINKEKQMNIHIMFTYWYLIILEWKTTYNTALWLLSSVIFLVTIATHIPFKFIFFTTLNLIQNIIIISISHTNRMFLYGFFCLNPVTNILRDVLDISYCDHINMWMKYYACCYYFSLLQWLLFPITIGVLLHGAKILCLDN